MEWLFQKMIENVGESYSPQLVKQILDVHHKVILRILWCGGIVALLLAIYVIFNEIRFRKFEKKLKKIKKNY